MNRLYQFLFFYFSFVSQCDAGTIYEERINLLLLTRDRTYSERLVNARSLFVSSAYNQSKPSLFLVFGYQDGPDGYLVNRVRDPLAERDLYNVFVIDWSAFNKVMYNLAIMNCITSGATVARTLDGLVQADLVDPTQIYLVGHSLGAQMTGYIGRRMRSGRIGRITGLDPAGPGFESFKIAQTLQRGDAACVDIIHTDGGYYGTRLMSGDMDFYPNGGERNQPNCPTQYLPMSSGELCSHLSAVEYYTTTIRSEKIFPAYQCDIAQCWRSNVRGRDLDRCLNNNCPKIRNDIYMGFGSCQVMNAAYYVSV